MADEVESDLSDEEENSLLVACVDSYESFAAISTESLHWMSETAGNPDASSQFEQKQTDGYSASSSDNVGSESSIVDAATLRQTKETFLKGSVLLRLVRPGYVWVSDLSSQAWCEMQMYYNLTLPLEMNIEFQENPAMQIGSTIHLARELAVHDHVSILVESKEDSIGIKLLNLLSAIKTFHSNGTVAREIPVFGTPFGKDLFVVGLIDELRFDPNTYTIDLVELKTRQNRTIPSRFVKKQHRIQVMLYRKLFDDLVKGLLSKMTIAEKFAVSLEKKFNQELITHIMSSGFYFENLSQLLDYVLRLIQSLTCISQMYVEYVHQETMHMFDKEKVTYSEVELCHFFSNYADFWLSKRDPLGVDIEDAYKCQMCEHAHLCEWRETKNQEYVKKNLAAMVKS